MVFDCDYFEKAAKDEVLAELKAKVARLESGKTAVRAKTRAVAPKTRGRPKLSYVPRIAKHYGVSPTAVYQILKRCNQANSVDAAPRTGRPSQITPVVVEHVRQAINKENGPSGRRLTKLVQESFEKENVVWKGKYGDYEETGAPSRRTIDMIKHEKLQIHTLRTRPALDTPKRKRRLEWAQARVDLGMPPTMDTDEAYVSIAMKSSVLALYPGEGVPKDAFLEDTCHFPIKQLYLMVLTQPEIINPDREPGEAPVFHAVRNGKVALVRLRYASERVKRRRGENGTLIPVEEDEPVYKNATVSGDSYAWYMTQQGGVLDMIHEYIEGKEDRISCKILCFDPKKAKTKDEYAKLVGPDRVPVVNQIAVLQEDNAGGHGMHRSAASAIHDWLQDESARRGVELVQQPACSPETNLNDLAGWSILKSGVGARQHEIPPYRSAKDASAIEKKLWEITQDVWRDIEPRKVFNACKQKEAVTRALVELEGGTIANEMHTGIRKLHLTGSPQKALRPMRG